VSGNLRLTGRHQQTGWQTGGNTPADLLANTSRLAGRQPKTVRQTTADLLVNTSRLWQTPGAGWQTLVDWLADSSRLAVKRVHVLVRLFSGDSNIAAEKRPDGGQCIVISRVCVHKNLAAASVCRQLMMS
jgi:hypothetical protein